MLAISMNKYFLDTLGSRKEIQMSPFKLDSTSPMPYTRSSLVSPLTSQLSIHLYTDLFVYLLGMKGWAGYSEGYKDIWYTVPCWLIIKYDK